ncbi:MAG: TldD/PmbA family protein [Lentisphaeria bacterium]|nr:TldD/PmbA family protein [Lentisphaeria bacterium]
MTRQEAFDILDQAVTATAAESVVATLGGSSLLSCRLADNVATQCVRRADASLSISCAYGQSHGSAVTNRLSPEGIATAARRAAEAARLAPPDTEFMPPLPAREASQYADIEAWSDATARRDPTEIAAELEEAVGVVAAAGCRLSGAWSGRGTFHACANSNGLRAYHRATEAAFRATVLTEGSSGWAQETATAAGDVVPARVAREALRIARDARAPTEMAPGRYTVILSPAAVAEMLPWHLVCDAKATAEGRTFLRGKLGTMVCAPSVSVRSDPTDPRCPASPFVGGGLAAAPVHWVRNGVLENLWRSRYWAAKTGTEPSRGPTNLILDGGSASLEDLVASTERGILVTRFWYIRFVDPMTCLLTGMTRDGLFLVENGRITRPLRHMRFNERVLTALSNVEALGQPQRIGGSLVPALKIREFTFSSTTTF